MGRQGQVSDVLRSREAAGGAACAGGVVALVPIPLLHGPRTARAAASLLQSKERLSLVQLVRGGRMFLCPAHRWVAVPLVLIGFAAC